MKQLRRQYENLRFGRFMAGAQRKVHLLHTRNCMSIFDDFVGIEGTGALLLNVATELKPLLAHGAERRFGIIANNSCRA